MENEGTGYEIKGTVYEITGTVRGRGGVPVRNGGVTVWWRHIREQKQLADGHTSDDGRYHLRYELPKEPPQPVLIQVAAQAEGLKPVISSLREAEPTLEIDLNFETPDVSRWTTLLAKLAPLLEGLKLTDLVENADHEDLTFLARETGESTEMLMQVAIAARLEALFSIAAPVFFAFLSQRIPPTIPSPLLDASDNFALIDALAQNIAALIFALTTDLQTAALSVAVETEVIGPQFAKQTPDLVKQLQSHRVNNLLNQPFSTGNTTLAQILDVAALPKDKQAAFSAALANNDQRMRDFWRVLKTGQLGVSPADAESIQRALSLGGLVKNHVPLLQTLEAQFVAGKYTALSQLATLSDSDWVALVKQTGPPPNIDAAGDVDPVEVFANVVYARVTRAYPTVALSSRVSQSEIVPPHLREPLTRFFRNNSDLELLRANLAVYLETKGEAAFEGINADQRPLVLANARTFQRVLRLAPTVDAAESLLTARMTSATQIANLGRQQFFDRATAAGLTKREANQAYSVAAHRYARTVTMYMQLNREAIGVWPKAIGDLASLIDPIDQAIRRDQSLATLFGSQDYCSIEDCTSVLSPAAYLCDLLLWLRNHPQSGHTARSTCWTADVRISAIYC